MLGFLFNKYDRLERAIFLSVLVPGLGHIANGHWARGICLSLLFTTIYYAQAYFGTIYRRAGLFLCAIISVASLLYIIIDSCLISIKRPQLEKKWYMKWYGIVSIIILATILFLYIDTLHFVPRNYRVASNSMSDTLFIADHILIDLTAYDSHLPGYDDIIVFILPDDESRWFIKRVIGKPGDTVCIENKQVFVNGQKRIEDYTIFTDTKLQKRRDTMPSMTIPSDTYFVLGDNRDESYDSRFFGPIAKEKIIGKARIIIWSDTWSRIGKTL
mgnify:CR=1 FL=1